MSNTYATLMLGFFAAIGIAGTISALLERRRRREARARRAHKVREAATATEAR